MKPNWQTRFDALFKDITQVLTYNPAIESDKQAKPLYLALVEFMETVYNEGVKNGKESVKENLT